MMNSGKGDLLWQHPRTASTDKTMIEIAVQIAEDATESYRCLVGKMYIDPKNRRVICLFMLLCIEQL